MLCLGFRLYIAKTKKILGQNDSVAEWEERAKKRKNSSIQYLWDGDRQFFKEHSLWEKYNVVNIAEIAGDGCYGPSVNGFGWTNAIFKVFAEHLKFDNI
ncbi:MAG: hypothetical protein F6K25_00820 [Okeania sp. SIO2G4]|uniref:trehalase family glycosidase n=1 Tax=unclassified Okeania TaxID=2634635 RepID=UPI0013BAE635|nr:MULTISPECIES: trehalase family glycosidase [unclassified Okeania]NEP04331.1 hypothetical protein [Okeania sp. SIO4D6]NEP41022.1 hypothetical protein [Okeania sp. SIO2H7]NEP71088.1 hypothetical protein [Okeania sp. SIO2G5]NEP91490.1 hypothetical protein [Okeania sp. SIO2F5]NEQ89367.1 hypothetical protein [Okeania sp. SIO2G4]